jgi:hypothetical protein
VVNVRGAIVLGTVRFVMETYGPEAHAKVLKALHPKHCATFLGSVREASWEPAVDLEAYVEIAKAMLAPNDPDFFKRAGYFAGRAARNAGFEAFLADPQRLSAFLWRGLFDTGRVEVVSHDPAESVGRIHDFPTSRSACARMVGAWEGLFDARVVHTACVMDGSPYCEMRLFWAQRPG